MTENIPENKARQGGLGRPVLVVLVSGLLLAAVAWGVAEIYGEQAKTPASQQNSEAAAPAATPSNSQPVDQSPKVDKNPTR